MFRSGPGRKQAGEGQEGVEHDLFCRMGTAIVEERSVQGVLEVTGGGEVVPGLEEESHGTARRMAGLGQEKWRWQKGAHLGKGRVGVELGEGKERAGGWWPRAPARPAMTQSIRAPLSSLANAGWGAKRPG
jgi:hypothetical protein